MLSCFLPLRPPAERTPFLPLHISSPTEAHRRRKTRRAQGKHRAALRCCKTSPHGRTPSGVPGLVLLPRSCWTREGQDAAPGRGCVSQHPAWTPLRAPQLVTGRYEVAGCQPQLSHSLCQSIHTQFNCIIISKVLFKLEKGIH